MYPMSDMGFQAVYNVLSFTLASMMATTMHFWFRAGAVQDEYKSAVFISGLVTFIAAYHYIRIFNSWVDSYQYSAGTGHNGALEMMAPALIVVPFNDAYRYRDWLLTVHLLVVEILLVMKRDDETYSAKDRYMDWLLTVPLLLVDILLVMKRDDETSSAGCILLTFFGCFAEKWMVAAAISSLQHFFYACFSPLRV